MAGSALDVARRQVAGLDVLIDRALRRRPATTMPGPQRLLSATSDEGRHSVTGYYAGPVSRAVGAVLDAIILFATFTLGFAAVNLLSTVVLGISLDQGRTGIVATVAFVVWWFSYTFGSIAVSGRTFGKGLIGIRVFAADGESISVRRAFVRTLTFPLSLLFLGLGFVPLLVRRDHRALHDLLARDLCRVGLGRPSGAAVRTAVRFPAPGLAGNRPARVSRHPAPNGHTKHDPATMIART